MNRRAVLATVASGVGAMAGCSGLLPSRSREAPSGGGGSGGDGGDGGSGGKQSIGTTGECPSLPIDGSSISQLVCDGEQTNSEMYLSAENSSISLQKNTVDFTLTNESSSDALYAPCRWSAYKQSNQEWKAVQPLGEDTSTSILPSGSANAATLTLHINQSAPNGAEPCGYGLDGVDAGRYMFGVQGTLPTESTEALFLASFQLKG